MHRTIMNSLVLLLPLDAYIVAGASVSAKTGTIINLWVLLSLLNAYIVTQVVVSAKTMKTVT